MLSYPTVVSGSGFLKRRFSLMLSLDTAMTFLLGTFHNSRPLCRVKVTFKFIAPHEKWYTGMLTLLGLSWGLVELPLGFVATASHVAVVHSFLLSKDISECSLIQ